MKFVLGFFILKNQALDPDPYPDPHWFSKPWIRIRMKWMRIRIPVCQCWGSERFFSDSELDSDPVFQTNSDLYSAPFGFESLLIWTESPKSKKNFDFTLLNMFAYITFGFGSFRIRIRMV